MDCWIVQFISDGWMDYTNQQYWMDGVTIVTTNSEDYIMVIRKIGEQDQNCMDVPNASISPSNWLTTDSDLEVTFYSFTLSGQALFRYSLNILYCHGLNCCRLVLSLVGFCLTISLHLFQLAVATKLAWYQSNGHFL